MDQTQDITGYLKGVQTDDPTRGQAWDVYNHSANQQDFEQKLGSLNLPQQAKADLWESKYGSGRINNPQATTPPVTTQPKPTPPAQPASPAGTGVLDTIKHGASSLWGWANQPLNIAHLRQSIAEGDARDAAPPTLADVQEIQKHPVLGPIKQGAETFLNRFGNDAAKMLLTPLGVATAAIPGGEEGGAIERVAPTLAKGLRVAGKTVAGAFATKGAVGQVQQGVLKQPGESTADYLTRTSGNAAMLLGGATAGLHHGEAVPETPTNSPSVEDTSQTALPAPPIGQTIDAPMNFVDKNKAKGAARVAQAVGTPKGAGTTTVHVDPAFANELDQWNNSDLPAKRVILDPKKNQVKLANTNPEVGGFQYTKTNAPATFSTEPGEGTVPVTLSTTNGTRGTATPNHFLSAQVGEATTPTPQAPIPEPETPAPTPAEPTPAPSPTPEVAAPSELVPGTPAQPATISPKVVTPANPATGIGEVKLDTLNDDGVPATKGRVSLGGVKPGPKPAVTLEGGIPLKDNSLPTELAKNGDPDKGPLKIQAQGGPSSSKEITPQATTPPVDVSPIEDKIRPLVGQAIRLGQLRLGEAASSSIDKAIEQSQSLTSRGIDPLVKDQVSKLLKEPVGDNLTPAQVSKLETMRGAQGSLEPVLRHPKAEEIAQETNKDPDAWQRRLDASMSNMAATIKDPNTPPELSAKLTKALMSEDKNGNPKPWLYEKGTVQYPKPEALDATHPEAPFAPSKFGHEITPITMENLKAATGNQPRDLYFGRDGKNSLVTPEEQAEYARLKDGVTADPTGEPLSQEEQLEQDRKNMFGMTGADKDAQLRDLLNTHEGSNSGIGDVRSRANTSPEFRDYARQLRQTVLERKLNQTTNALKTQVGEWNKQRGGAQTELTQQLAKLSPEVRKYLPSELFDYEKPNAAAQSSPGSSPKLKKSLQTSSASPTKSASTKSGAETPFEGIKTNDWDTKITKKYPTEAQQIPALQEWTSDKYPVEQRQKMYDRITKAYHDGLENNSTTALKVALDILVNRGEAGFIDIGSGKTDPLLTPEQNRASNLDSAQRILTRWEDMSEPELLRKGAKGLWNSNLTNYIEGSRPISDDPEEQVNQMEEYNELYERHRALKQQVGTPTNVLHSLVDWSRNFAAADDAKRIIRSLKGTTNRDVAIQNKLFENVDKLFESLPIAEKDRVWDSIQRGKDVPPELVNVMDPKLVAAHEAQFGKLPDLNEMISRLRTSMDAAREKYTSHSGNLQEFRVNYMPGMYENAGRARVLGMENVDNRPLAGNADFLKQKIYEFQKDALAEGLQPVTNNPIRAGLSMIAQLNHASFAYELRNKFIDFGYAHWVPQGETPPTGWQAFDDRIFGERGSGQYFAPTAIAKTFNDYTSTGLKGKWLLPYTKFSMYDAIRQSNNMENLSQLSFSAFHASDVIANSFLTALTSAGQKIVNEGAFGGRLGRTMSERAKSVAQGLGQALTVPIAPIQDWAKGRKIEVNYHDPEKQTNYAQTTEDIEAANANVRPDQRFHLEQLERMKNAWTSAMDPDRGGDAKAGYAVKALYHVMGTVPEISTYPLMKSFIPAMKLGALDRAFKQVHSEYAGSHPDLIDSELQKASDSIDDRFGEMNWDNIFWNRTTKDIAMLFGRAPGWTIGTARAIAGGIKDIPGTVKDIATPGKEVHVSNRTIYLGAMVAATMMFNALRQYINTGQKAEGIDYLYPKNGTQNAYGEDNREYPKFLYTYEPLNWNHDALGTAEHKMAPGFAALSDIAKNQDYYHHEIYDAADGPVKKYQGIFSYVAKTALPFSLQNMQESKMRGGKNSIGSLFGIMPAPQWVGRSKAQNLAFGYYQGTLASGGKDDSVFEKQANFVQLRNQVQNGQLSPDQLQQAVDQGKIQPAMIKYLYATSHQAPIVTWTKRLNSENQVWNIWKAATDQEKQQLLPTMIQKMNKLSSGDNQTHYFEELEKFANRQSPDYQAQLGEATTDEP